MKTPSCTMWFRQIINYVTKYDTKYGVNPHSTEQDTQPIAYLEHSVTCLLSKAYIIFLTGETRKGVRFLMRQSPCISKSLTRFAPYSTSVFMQNSEAMSGGALSEPPLIGSTFAQVQAQNSNQIPPMKKEAPCFTNRKCPPITQGGSRTSDEKRCTTIYEPERHPKNARDTKTSNEKRGTVFHELETHPKMQGDQRPLMKKGAPHFTNQKCTPKNTRNLVRTKANP
jgi:hypothetical protein